MPTELTCAITVLDGIIYVEAEVEWVLRILKLIKRVLEVGQNENIRKILKGLIEFLVSLNFIYNLEKRKIKSLNPSPSPQLPFNLITVQIM